MCVQRWDHRWGRTVIEPGCWLNLASADARLTIGKNCWLGPGVMLSAFTEVVIEDGVSLGNRCWVGDSIHRHEDSTRTLLAQGFYSKGPVRIGSGSRFGVGCVVTSGVHVDEGTVLAPNSVITR